MINLERTEVMNFENAIRGMRNAMNSWDKSDSYSTHIEDPATKNTAHFAFFMGPADLELAQKLIKAGSEFTLLRTDGKTFVDAKLGDGRECRIYVERNSTDYQLCINGTPEYELFEEIYYAG